MTVFHVAVATAIICVQIVTALNDTEHQALKVQINDAKHAKEFSTLLNSIVNVNKERYDTLKRMSRLQQFPSYPPRQTLRGGESEDSSEDDDDGSGPEIVAYLVLPAEAQSLRASHKSEDTETEEETEKDVSKEKHTEKPSQLSVKDEIPIKGKNISDDDKLRDSLRSCTSKTIKRCKRACKKAKNEVCSVYACKRKMKTKFNKQCKKSCREEFKRERHGGSSIYSSDEDW
ncbi:uncharacterized protein isoform X1 [Choristoneura fumiferana]|uniref:uncharacterized protein isoform X1 n=1 Tax=Choristoneura fumiferana TaxID=7141 RepID=UPI003D15E8E9